MYESYATRMGLLAEGAQTDSSGHSSCTCQTWTIHRIVVPLEGVYLVFKALRWASSSMQDEGAHAGINVTMSQCYYNSSHYCP
jgi:hypothetical protein